MANENAKIAGGNYEKVLLAVTNDANLETRMLRVDPSTNRLLVDAGSITIDTTGLATSANQTTIIGHIDNIETYVDGIEALLTTIDADTGLLAGAITSNKVQVDVVTIPSHAVTNAGTFAVQVDGGALTALQLLDDTVFTDDSAFTIGTSKLNAIGLFVDESSTDTADEGDIGISRMTANRQAIFTMRPNASGEGLDIFRSLDLDETEEEIKATAGKVYGWYLFNAAASTRYIKFYNATAANVTVGTTTPVLTIPLPAGSAANVEFANGIPFSTAITVASTTGVADNDTGAPSANDVITNILYK